MLPKFKNWIENQEDATDQNQQVNDPGQGQQGNTSEPQHKKGEAFAPLNKVIERRMLEIIEELTRTGKANERQILDSIKYFLEKNSTGQNSQPQQSPPGQNSQPQPQQSPPGQAPQI